MRLLVSTHKESERDFGAETFSIDLVLLRAYHRACAGPPTELGKFTAHSIAPPAAIAILISPIAYATGPIKDVAIAVVDLPTANCRLPPRGVNAEGPHQRRECGDSGTKSRKLANEIHICKILPGLLIAVSDMLDLISAVPVPC